MEIISVGGKVMGEAVNGRDCGVSLGAPTEACLAFETFCGHLVASGSPFQRMGYGPTGATAHSIWGKKTRQGKLQLQLHNNRLNSLHLNKLSSSPPYRYITHAIIRLGTEYSKADSLGR